MGKVIEKKLPEDHPIFKAGWSLSSVKKISKKDKGIRNNKKPINRPIKD
jgi:hypothetical protein